MASESIAIAIFALTYLLIISEIVHKTVAAFLGALLMVVYGVVEYGTIGSVIDFRTLTIVLGIFIIINVVEMSGLFEYIALKALKFTKGDPFKLLYMTIILGFAISVFFTEIPTAMILGTIIIKISKKLTLNPVPYLLTIALVVDLGGILTPISSIQNIMISSSAGIRFMEFTSFMLPLWIMLMAASFFFFKLFFKKELQKENTSKEDLERLLSLDENLEIKNMKLFKRSLAILSIVMVLFFIQDYTGIRSDAVAMSGAIVMLLLSSANPDEVFAKVEWSVLAFFVGIFIVISGIEHAGILDKFTILISGYMKGAFSAVFTTIAASAFISSFVDNIPMVAMLIPIAKNLTQMLNLDSNILFYAIAAGTNIGGNITPIGSPSNMIIMGMADKEKKNITISDFIKVGLRYTAFTICIALAYFIIRIYLI